jgi:hypothetical protein
MDINITLLEAYSLKNGLAITTSIDIEDTEPYLKFIKGTDAHGSRAEYLQFCDIKNILMVNNMINDGGLVLKERDASQESLRQRPIDEQDKDKNIERLIYNTISKYIIQMLNAGTGQIYFPEIVPLENHKTVYFRVD